MQAVTNRLVRSYEGFGELKAEWDDIGNAGGIRTPFQDYAWIDLWLRHRGGGVEPFVLVCPDAATIAPFGLSRTTGTRVLRLLGTGDSDYPGLVTAISIHDAWARVIQELARRRGDWDLLHLHSVPEKTAILDSLKQHMASNARYRPYEVCPIVSTKRPWETLMEERGRLRGVVRRWGRRLQEMGEVAVEVVRPPINDVLLQELVEVERASWKWDQGTAAFVPGSRRNFIEGVLRDARIPANLWLLRISGKLTAFELILTAQNRWYGYMAVFRKEYRNAGSFLLARVMERACAVGCECVDLLRGDEQYKLAWTDVVTPVYEIVCPSTTVGRIAALSYQARWQAAKSVTLRRIRDRLTSTGDRRWLKHQMGPSEFIGPRADDHGPPQPSAAI